MVCICMPWGLPCDLLLSIKIGPCAHNRSILRNIKWACIKSRFFAAWRMSRLRNINSGPCFATPLQLWEDTSAMPTHIKSWCIEACIDTTEHHTSMLSITQATKPHTCNRDLKNCSRVSVTCWKLSVAASCSSHFYLYSSTSITSSSAKDELVSLPKKNQHQAEKDQRLSH
jgi:hypothetical protein